MTENCAATPNISALTPYSTMSRILSGSVPWQQYLHASNTYALCILTAYKKLHEKEDSARLVFGRRRSSGCVVLYLI